jgi:hypothetical protein
VDGGTGSFGLCVDKCIEHLFEKKYIEGVRHAGGWEMNSTRLNSKKCRSHRLDSTGT